MSLSRAGKKKCYDDGSIVEELIVTLDISEIKTLRVEERIRCVEEIWDSIVADQRSLKLSDAQRQELDRRLAAHEADPDAVVDWEVIKAEYQSDQ